MGTDIDYAVTDCGFYVDHTMMDSGTNVDHAVVIVILMIIKLWWICYCFAESGTAMVVMNLMIIMIMEIEDVSEGVDNGSLIQLLLIMVWLLSVDYWL